MDMPLQAIARQCLEGAENNSMSFPQIVQTLISSGFEGYLVDLRLGQATYYQSNGQSVELATHHSPVEIAAEFDANKVQAAIREAQMLVPGYTYKGFCDKVKRAGCAGYLVSFPGRRALYFGRTAETHVEHFPQK